MGMKNINAKLKEFTANKEYMFFISVLFMFIISTVVGLGDWDYYWQSYLGKEIVTHGKFDSLGDLIWGTKGLGHYVDHEWLTNVFFYLCKSTFGTFGGVVAIKLVLESLFVFVTFYFVKYFIKDFSKMSWFTYLACMVSMYCFSMMLLKPKAYDFSVLFTMLLIISIEKYRANEKTFKRFAIDILLITILWNNMHSGSVILVFVICGLYWLFWFRDVKTLLLGIGVLGSLLINPFGYKLIAFDVSHFSDDMMKFLISEWAGLSLATYGGKVFALLLIIAFIHIMHMDRKQENWVYFAMYILFFLLAVNSRRHFLYMYPIALITFVLGQYEDLKKWPIKSLFAPTLVITFISIWINMLVWMTYADFDKQYTMQYIYTDELRDMLKADLEENTEGFYDGHVFIDGLEYKSFLIGAFPYVKERSWDAYCMEYGSPKDIEEVIEKYGLDKFLLIEKSRLAFDYPVMRDTNLYAYLKDNSDYECKYDDGRLAYFVKKEVK